MSMNPKITESTGQKITIAVLGSTASGKTRLIHRYVTGIHEIYCDTAIGLGFMKKKLCIRNHDVNLHICETSGLKKFDPIVRRWSTKMHLEGFLIVYDVTCFESYLFVKNRIILAREINKEAPIIVVGNKSDLGIRDFPRHIFDHALLKNVSFATEASAKTGENVQEAFDRLAQKIFKAKYLSGEPTNTVLESVEVVPCYTRNLVYDRLDEKIVRAKKIAVGPTITVLDSVEVVPFHIKMLPM